MSTFEKGLMVCVAAIDAVLVVTGIWSFIISYCLIIIGLTFYTYYGQE